MIAVCLINTKESNDTYSAKCSIYNGSGKLDREVIGDALKSIIVKDVEAKIVEVSERRVVLVITADSIDIVVEDKHLKISKASRRS